MTPFNPQSFKLAAAHETSGVFHAVCLDEPGRVLYGAGTDGHLHRLDLALEKPTLTQGAVLHDNYVSGLVLHQGTLISAGYDGKLNWTDPKTNRSTRSVSAHRGWVRKVLVRNRYSEVLTIGDDMRLHLWDADSGRRRQTFDGHADRTPEGYLSALYALAVSEDGHYAATGDRAGFVRVWDLERGASAAEFRASDFYTFDPVKRARAIGGVRGLAFSPDGRRLAISGIGRVTNVDGFVGPCRIESWDWQAGKRVAFGQDKHQAILNHVTFGPEGTWLTAAGGGDGGGALVFWNGQDQSTLVVAKPKGHLHDFRFDGKGATLFAGGHQGIQIWKR